MIGNKLRWLHSPDRAVETVVYEKRFKKILHLGSTALRDYGANRAR
ncbi:MAG: hypothetical protein U9P70_04680 [Patescibacteria group bacterium]|nr:hypothetical protein [Patescibacteria group bacterium]